MKRIVAVMFLAGRLAMGQIPVKDATITVDPTHVENRISPRMYAAFVEMMGEDVKWGMTAEMVHDRSFEEAPNYLGLPADWRLEPDTRNDNVGAIRFEQVTDESYPKTSRIDHKDERSLRIVVAPEDITDTRRGLSQGRISVVAGQTYDGYVWVKLPQQGGYAGVISVALEEDETDGATYATASLTLDEKSDDWQQYRFHLVPDKSDRFAKLTFLFPGKGTLYLDQVSLEPATAKEQVRADSEAMIEKLHPSFLRWPGGNVAQDYHWQWGIGPRDMRPVWSNKAWSNAPEPNDLGTDEYLALCERLHIEPSITVNVNGNDATPEEAAAWMEYVNGPANSKYGAMRAANGHAAPYNVKQWELGNEIFGGWVRGHVDAETYAHSAVTYANAMRAVDPTIKLIAVGEGIMPDQDAWNSAVLRIAGAVIDYLAIHDYTSASQNAKAVNTRTEMMARAAEFEGSYRHTADLIAQYAPGRSIKQIVNEWNLFYGAETIQSMDGAVYAARMMNGFERDGDTVEANCISDLLNGWVGGVIQTSRDRVYGTAQYWALKMYRDHMGSERVQATTDSQEMQDGVKTVDAIATRSAVGSHLFIKMSSADTKHTTSVHVVLKGESFERDAHLTVLAAKAEGQRNSFAVSDALMPSEKLIHCSGEQCMIDLPPDSVAVLTADLKH